jgi:hypothetical protein
MKRVAAALTFLVATACGAWAQGHSAEPAPRGANTNATGASALVTPEPMARLHADGKGWRLDQAKVIDPTRPRVLLIGDSILNGYFPAIAKALEGKAYVDAWITAACQATPQLDAQIAQVLAHGPYDIIHFNMGLHGWPKGRIPEGQFEPLTKMLVENLRRGAPTATLIWASTTPVTAKAKPVLDSEINPIILEHNRMAAQVMRQLHVPIEDLYGVLSSHLDLARGDQFHWRPEGTELLAQAVTKSLLEELTRRSGRAPKSQAKAGESGRALRQHRPG